MSSSTRSGSKPKRRFSAKQLKAQRAFAAANRGRKSKHLPKGTDLGRRGPRI